MAKYVNQADLLALLEKEEEKLPEPFSEEETKESLAMLRVFDMAKNFVSNMPVYDSDVVEAHARRFSQKFSCPPIYELGTCPEAFRDCGECRVNYIVGVIRRGGTGLERTE